ncbi:MAG: TonB-dependent receptor [Prevotella sp.]|nr:TonB-dependent receptor [Prevotella sp.]
MKHALILLLLLTLCACSDPQEQPRDSLDLTGAWVLRHVEFPSGTEQDYALLRDSRSRSTSFSVAATKNIPTLFAKLGADGSYSFGSGEQAVDETVIDTRTNSYALHGNATITPVPWLELRYDINYGWSRSRYSEESNTTTSLTHSGAVHIFPIAALDLSLDYDHVRRQITTDQYKRMSLFNASVQYKWKQCVLRLELTNLLNQRSYSYTVFDGINTYTYDYTLCGRTIMMKATFKL